MALREQGASEKEAYSKIWMVDSRGLIVKVSVYSFYCTIDRTKAVLLSSPLLWWVHCIKERWKETDDEHKGLLELLLLCVEVGFILCV